MWWSRSGFTKHYKLICVKGQDAARLLNVCIVNGIAVRKVKFLSDNEIILKIKHSDYGRFCEQAGARYDIHVLREDGYALRLRNFGKRKALIAGLLLFSGIIFYQSLFISDIEISGYESISEQALRRELEEAGFYEGCRKNVNISKVKLHVYEKFDKVSWIGIKYKGNLAHVMIAEVDSLYEKNKVEDTVPCNIVADKNGYINSIDPEQGVRAVEDGAYVKKGDVIISGIVPLTKTTYEEESETETEMYVHAEGTADAKVPVRLDFFRESYEVKKNETGRKMITVSVNGKEVMNGLCPYEISAVKRYDLCDLTKPFRLKIQINSVKEINIKKQEITENAAIKEAINKTHQFVKEKLPDNTQILNKSLNFTREKNIIRVGVTLETLQEIGIEEEIIVDKSNRQSDQNDD